MSGAGAANPGVRVAARTYSLLVRSDRPVAVLEDAAGRHWADLFLAWSADSSKGQDSTFAVGEIERQDVEDGVRISVPMRSATWRAKTLVIDCFQDRLELRLRLDGEGALNDLHLLAGSYSGDPRHGSGFFRSGARFVNVFNPEPSRAELRVRPAWASTVIDVLGTSVPGSEHWFSTPAPFCYAFGREEADAWAGFGLAVERGQNTFTGFHYEALEDSFGLRLSYEGHTDVRGEWTSPALVIALGARDPYEALEYYVLGLEKAGLVPSRGRPEGPAWWARPIFCGWGAQSHLAHTEGGRAADHATQDRYEAFLSTLRSRALEPGTVVIDDKWQLEYGSGSVDERKWPDLRGWIASRHGEGKKVLLWWKAWDPEGLPAELCVVDDAGRPITVDPSNPAYESRLRQTLRALLGPEGFDADGLKLDFTARTPSGPGLRRHGPEWGVELLHRLLAIIYSECKAAKPDALVITHTPNPYFRDVTDMIRLNDVNIQQPVVEQMRHRARIAGIACPDALIDTDNWPMPDRETWRDYIAVQATLGVPSLYYATHVDTSGEEFDTGDYAALAHAWRQPE